MNIVFVKIKEQRRADEQSREETVYLVQYRRGQHEWTPHDILCAPNRACLPKSTKIAARYDSKLNRFIKWNLEQVERTPRVGTV